MAGSADSILREVEKDLLRLERQCQVSNAALELKFTTELKSIADRLELVRNELNEAIENEIQARRELDVFVTGGTGSERREGNRGQLGIMIDGISAIGKKLDNLEQARLDDKKEIKARINIVFSTAVGLLGTVIAYYLTSGFSKIHLFGH